MRKKGDFLIGFRYTPSDINGTEYKCHFGFEEESILDLIEGIPEEIISYKKRPLFYGEKLRSDKNVD